MNLVQVLISVNTDKPLNDKQINQLVTKVNKALDEIQFQNLVHQKLMKHGLAGQGLTVTAE